MPSALEVPVCASSQVYAWLRRLAYLQVAPAVKDAMQRKGDAMIGFQPLKGLPNFFRIVFPSAWGITCEDLNELLDRIDQYGTQLCM